MQPTEAELCSNSEKQWRLWLIKAFNAEAAEKLQVAVVKKLASLNARLVITSYLLKAVEARFPDMSNYPIVAHEVDPGLHIHQEIVNSRNLQGVSELEEADASLKDEIVSLVKQKCGGMFLHTSLQLESISECTSL